MAELWIDPSLTEKVDETKVPGVLKDMGLIYGVFSYEKASLIPFEEKVIIVLDGVIPTRQRKGLWSLLSNYNVGSDGSLVRSADAELWEENIKDPKRLESRLPKNLQEKLPSRKEW